MSRAGGRELAAQIVGMLTERGQTVAVAESLTGGLLGAAITDVPGASVVFRGGIIAYATELKAALLGVPAELLACYAARSTRTWPPRWPPVPATGSAPRSAWRPQEWPDPTRRTASRQVPCTSR